MKPLFSIVPLYQAFTIFVIFTSISPESEYENDWEEKIGNTVAFEEPVYHVPPPGVASKEEVTKGENPVTDQALLPEYDFQAQLTPFVYSGEYEYLPVPISQEPETG